jgi:hypothetical protein
VSRVAFQDRHLIHSSAIDRDRRRPE